MYNLSKDSIKILKSITKNSKEILKHANVNKAIYKCKGFIGSGSFLLLEGQCNLFDNQFKKSELEHRESKVDILQYENLANEPIEIIEKYKYTKIVMDEHINYYFNSHYIRFINLNVKYNKVKVYDNLAYFYNNDNIVVAMCYGMRMNEYDVQQFEIDLSIEDYIKEYEQQQQEQKELEIGLCENFYKQLHDNIVTEFKKIISVNKEIDLNILAGGELTFKDETIYHNNRFLCYMNTKKTIFSKIARKTFNKFAKENTIESLINTASEQLKKDLESINIANETKYIIEDCKALVNKCISVINKKIDSIELLDNNITANDNELKYILRIELKIGDNREYYFVKLNNDNKIMFNDYVNKKSFICDTPESFLSGFKKYINDNINKELVRFNKERIIEELKVKLLKNDSKIVIRKLVNDKYEYITTDGLFYNELNRKKEKCIGKIRDYSHLKELFNNENTDICIIHDNIVPDAKMLKSLEYFIYSVYEETELKNKNDLFILSEFTDINNDYYIYNEYVKPSIIESINTIIESGYDNKMMLTNLSKTNYFIIDVSRTYFKLNDIDVKLTELIESHIKKRLNSYIDYKLYSIKMIEIIFSSIYNKALNSILSKYIN